MRVILTENIEKVGSKGEVVNVKRGFARNYLVPRKFAIYATPQNLKRLEGLQKQFADEESKRLSHLKQIGEQITALKLTFVRKADEHDNMYGSVSEMDILNELKENNIDIPKSAVLMEKHIKQLGDFEVNIHLHKDVNVTLQGVINKEAEEKEAVEQKEKVPGKSTKKAADKEVAEEPVVEPAVEAETPEESVAEAEVVAEVKEEPVEVEIKAEEAVIEEETENKISE